MCERIGAVCIYEEIEQGELSFWDIFLDERLLTDVIYISKTAISKVGYLNRRLQNKQIYELMLRIAKEYLVLCMTQVEFNTWKEQQDEEWHIPVIEMTENAADDYLTDCYVIGRYKSELIEVGLFETVIESMILQNNQQLNTCLEEMLSESKAYYELYDATQPILIYRGDDICYGILDYFAKKFGEALLKQNELVEYFDVSKQDLQDIFLYDKKRWKAIIGVQTYMFSLKKVGGSFVHDNIDAPLYNFVFDHPIWMRHHLETVPKGMTVLTLDDNYVKFIETYYGHKAIFFPPAGVESEKILGTFEQRKYDVSFVGSYGEEWGEKLFELKKNNYQKAKFANHFLKNLRKEKNKTPEDVLWKTLEEMKVECDLQQFKEIFGDYKWMISVIRDYYRKKILQILLRAGIEVHVFGDTWKESPLQKYSNLIWHEAVKGDEALEIYAQSKISLNIMSWHKGAFTERIANAMLQKSVVLTDKTTYLMEHFRNEENICMFDLEKIEQLPDRVKEMLRDIKRLEYIGECGYKKAKEEHTWEARAKKILEI